MSFKIEDYRAGNAPNNNTEQLDRNHGPRLPQGDLERPFPLPRGVIEAEQPKPLAVLARIENGVVLPPDPRRKD